MDEQHHRAGGAVDLAAVAQRLANVLAAVLDRARRGLREGVDADHLCVDGTAGGDHLAGVAGVEQVGCLQHGVDGQLVEPVVLGVGLHPAGHATRALGTEETVEVDTRIDAIQSGDILLLCSDGLSGPVSADEIVEILGVVALFGFLNRWNDSMGTTLEPIGIAAGEKNLVREGWDVGKHV